MQTLAATTQPGRAPDAAATPAAAATTSARLLAVGATGGDFLSLLLRDSGKTEHSGEAPRPRERGEPTEDENRPARNDARTAEAADPQAAALPGQGQLQPAATGGQGERLAQADPGRGAAPADSTAPRTPALEVAAAPRQADGLKAAIDPAAVESRPRAALAGGTSQVALVAQDQGAAQGQAQAQSPAPSLQARAAAQGREAGSANPANTTLAGLEALAEAKQTAKAQAGPGQAQAGQTQGAQGQGLAQGAAGQNGLPGQPGLAQAAQIPAQAGERAQTGARSAALAAGGTAQPLSGAAGATQSAALPGGEGLNGGTQVGRSDSAAAPKPAATGGRAAQPAVDQVAVRIQKAAAAGQDRIQIKLNPAELGRVDVKLEFQSDGGVRAVVSVERPETFDLLQRDARSLERALQDAGFKPGQTNLSFEMNTGGQGGGFASQDFGEGQGGLGRDAAPAMPAGDATTAEIASPAPRSGAAAGDGRVDLRI